MQVHLYYEFLPDRTPYPVCYYNEKPLGKREREFVVTFYLDDGETVSTILLNSFVEAYPHPKLLKIKTKDVKKEQKMTRPVQGYLDSHGTFFDTEAEAEFSDASFLMFTYATDAVEELKANYNPHESPPLADMLVEFLTGFIRDSETAIYDYITTKRKLQESSASHARAAAVEDAPEAVGVVGPAVEGGEVAGVSVPAESSSPLGDSTDAEAEPTKPRNRAKSKTGSVPDITDL